MKKGIQQFLDVILDDSREDLGARLKKAGFGSEDIGELCGTPGADRQILNAAVNRHVLPRLPAILKQIALSAASPGPGSGEAQRMIIQLFAPKGPLSESLGDLGSFTDDGLARQMTILMRQMEEELDKVGTAQPVGQVKREE